MDERAAAGRFVVTGVAGFFGSHLCEALLRRGHEVVGVDDLSSGRRCNLASFSRHPGFTFREGDIRDGVPVRGPVDGLFHLISPSPVVSGGRDSLQPMPATGVDVVSEFCRRRSCRLLVVGHVGAEYEDPFDAGPGPDGADQIASAHRDVRIARLFSSYGPRMEPEDEPMLSSLLLQALTGQPMSIEGDGADVRSSCFVSDQVNGLLRLFRSDVTGVAVDLGDPHEHRVRDLVDAIRNVTGTSSAIVSSDRRAARPVTRQLRPDVTIATDRLGWAPRVPLDAGLATTASWMRNELGPTVGHSSGSQLRTA